MTLYLLGIFIGAIDTGIVTPARTVIQNDLGVNDQTGVWMITIYTLAYAASIPVMGKLADRVGRKPVYLVAITLFGVGSLLCGLSEATGSFTFLILARAVQAIGGGGILPIATAEFGTAVPPEKRGLALGLVGAVFGIANIFGSSAGSLILDVAGAHNWQWLFYVNVPICGLIIVGGLIFLPNHRAEKVARVDLIGIVVLVAMIMALLYGLRNLDFFNLGQSLQSLDVWPFLVGAAVLLPLFILAERRAADPVINLGFFTHRDVSLTLLLAFFSGVILMGVVFIPQFAENAVHLPSGAGGYYVIVLGLASGIGAPVSGRLTDSFGAKPVLGFGLVASIIGAAVLIWWAIPQPSVASVTTSLALLGLGLGFTIGSPLNYMMLEHTDPAESNSALATLSLVRSIGTTIAPAIMVGFLANAGTLLQPALTDLLPREVTTPPLPYAKELDAAFARYRTDPELKDRLAGVEFPQVSTDRTIEIDPTGGGTLAADLVDLLKTADVTTITERVKTVAVRMFDSETPATIADITAGVDTGLDGLTEGQRSLVKADASLSNTIQKMTEGIQGQTKGINSQGAAIAKMTRGIAGMTSGIAGQTRGINGLTSAINGMRSGVAGLTKAIAGIDAGLASQRTKLAELEVAYQASHDPALLGPIQGLKAGISSLESQRSTTVAKRSQLSRKLATAQASRNKLIVARSTLIAQRTALTQARARLIAARQKLITARAKLREARDDVITARRDVRDRQADLAETVRQLRVLRAAVPGSFETAKQGYLAAIEERRPEIERTFQATLNLGFRDVYLTTAAASLAALLALLAYRRPAAAPWPAPASATVAA